jgi:hypothetical protein
MGPASIEGDPPTIILPVATTRLVLDGFGFSRSNRLRASFVAIRDHRASGNLAVLVERHSNERCMHAPHKFELVGLKYLSACPRKDLGHRGNMPAFAPRRSNASLIEGMRGCHHRCAGFADCVDYGD